MGYSRRHGARNIRLSDRTRTSGGDLCVPPVIEHDGALQEMALVLERIGWNEADHRMRLQAACDLAQARLRASAAESRWRIGRRRSAGGDQ